MKRDSHFDFRVSRHFPTSVKIFYQGGGNGGGMEERITKLEKAVDKLNDQVTGIRVDVSVVKEKVDHLPTKPWMFATLAATVGCMIVLLTFIIGMVVRYMPHSP